MPNNAPEGSLGPEYGLDANKPLISNVPDGTVFNATDTGIQYQVQNGAWVAVPVGSSQLPSSVASVGTLATVATQYVTTDGNDANDGLGWGSGHAKATIQAAINALGASGGTVEIGYGTWTITAPLTIALANGPVRVRGRGMGQTYDATNLVTVPVRLTTIKNNGTGDAMQITGGLAAEPPTGILVEDVSIVGNALSGAGINATYCPRLTLRRVALDSHATFGLLSNSNYWVSLDTVVMTRNGLAAATTPSGGWYISDASSQADESVGGAVVHL